MTKRARILQADMIRAVRAARAAGPDARVIIDLDRRKIEIILNSRPEADSEANPWDDDHGRPQTMAS